MLLSLYITKYTKKFSYLIPYSTKIYSSLKITILLYYCIIMYTKRKGGREISIKLLAELFKLTQ